MSKLCVGYEAVLFPYYVLNQFFIITGIGDRVNAPPQRRAGCILIQEWQLRAPSAGSEFPFPWILYTLNCSDRVTVCTVKFLCFFVWVLFLLCKVIFCFPDSICSLSEGKEEAAFWRAVHDWVMLISLMRVILSTPLLLATAFLLCSPKQEKKKIFSRKKSFFLFFLPHCLLSTLSNLIAFPQQNYRGCGCGCIMNFVLIYFSSFHRFLGHLKYGSSQGKPLVGCL